MCSIPRGQGAVVALKAMIEAFGTLVLNLLFWWSSRVEKEVVHYRSPTSVWV